MAEDLMLLGAEERGRRKGFGQGIAFSMKARGNRPDLLSAVNDFLAKCTPPMNPLGEFELFINDGCPLSALAYRFFGLGVEDRQANAAPVEVTAIAADAQCP